MSVYSLRTICENFIENREDVSENSEATDSFDKRPLHFTLCKLHYTMSGLPREEDGYRKMWHANM